MGTLVGTRKGPSCLLLVPSSEDGEEEDSRQLEWTFCWKDDISAHRFAISVPNLVWNLGFILGPLLSHQMLYNAKRIPNSRI